jgi:dipeptidyl-peptidase-4
MSLQKGDNSAQFSKGFKYYILMHSDANTPTDFSLYDAKGKLIRMLKDNASLKERMAKYNLTKKEFFTFKNNAGIDLNCWIMKPTNFDSSKKYPVLVAIYGGPGSNTVSDAWGGRGYLWEQLLCQQGYIVVSCDPRGTQYRGREFKHSTYMNLGKLETEDFIDFAKYLGGQSYVDASRIGIQGWSFGGYMTSLCMTKGADYYKAGIAVAPVTNWKYYDSIYTERFMRTPQENSGGYENNSPINFVKSLKGKFLLVHGSADDNVHYQNSMDMITALVAANKQFDMFIYPNKNHGISGGNTRLHLYTRMTQFLTDNL